MEKNHAKTGHIQATSEVKSVGTINKAFREQISTKTPSLFQDGTEDQASSSTCAVLARASSEDIKSVEEWQEFALRNMTSFSAKDKTFSIKLLFDASIFYESIGQVEKSLEISKRILHFARERNDSSLIRRAHNSLGACFSRVCDFKASFVHIEQAYKIATANAEPTQILASLANASATLYSAGLTHAARDLALRGTNLPSEAPGAKCLHLMNSNNGIRFSHAVGDIDAADYFYEQSITYYDQQATVMNEVTRAYFEAFTAQHLISKGRSNEAIDSLTKATTRTAGLGNVRVVALLSCALANCYVSIGDLGRALESEKTLNALLFLTKSLSFHHEEILYTLVNISAMSRSQEGRAKSIQVAERLREYVVSTRYSQFFEAIARSYADSEDYACSLGEPKQSIPAWLDKLTFDEKSGERSSPYYAGDTLPASGQLSAEGERLRSTRYEVAEDWAVAAEFLSGGDWRQCFGGGELVRVIGLQCQLSSHQATVLGLAARLRGIGKIATVRVGFSDNDWTLTTFAKNKKHAEAGARLLSGSSDVILQMASRIAASSCEWWNGCGSPLGLRGENIPLEARICAVVDAFLGLTRSSAQVGWLMPSVIQQMSCMAGVQLDPELVKLLIKVIQVRDESDEGFWDGPAEVTRNNLVRSKKELFDVLELRD